LPPVALGQVAASDHDFADLSGGHFSPCVIQHNDVHVLDRISDRHHSGGDAGVVIDEELTCDPAFCGAEAVDEKRST
jgi:hypothetical protein